MDELGIRNTSKVGLALFVLLLVILTLFPIFFLPVRVQTITAYTGSGAQQRAYEVVQHPLPSGSTEPWAIATDVLGRVWFVQQGSNQLGMLDPETGNITEFSIPTPNSTAISVATDYQGNVWFSELASNKLGELKNGSKTIDEFAVPGAPYQIAGRTQFQSCGPSGVVTDSFGQIWVLCIFSNQIDEFFPKNVTFFDFDLPIYMSSPGGLVFDHEGGFWFTAADADMLGHGILSQVRNGTSNGISEFAPMNQTYSFTFEKALGPFGPYQNNTSSLPTPNGIALSQDGNILWITEHVDSSFDSYNIKSGSLVRYWTSKTNGAFGYSVSFPNGIAIDKVGNVWISEHYGNKIAEFNPKAEALIEYVIPCCGTVSAGTYTLTLGANGTVWFVEISGNAIGELKPVPANQTFSLNLGASIINFGSTSTTDIPLQISLSGGEGITAVSLNISGMSRTGDLIGATAKFSPEEFQVPGTGSANGSLAITTKGLSSGSYYLTVSASLSPEGVIYSQILKLTVSSYESLFVYAIIIGSVISVFVLGSLAFIYRRRRFTAFRRGSRGRKH